MLFSHTIEDEKSWSITKQKTVAFVPLIEHILKSKSMLLGDILKIVSELISGVELRSIYTSMSMGSLTVRLLNRLMTLELNC